MKVFRQYAALPYIVLPEGPCVCLITSRERGRWVIPKGWPKAKHAPYELARREARQEAGLDGIVSQEPIGTFNYRKKLHMFAYVTCLVTVFPMLCDIQKVSWREKDERQLDWFSPQRASELVEEPELKELIKNLPDWLANSRPVLRNAS